MLTRIITAVCALCLLVPILIFAPSWAVVCVWGLLGAVAVYEFASCLGLKKEKWLVICSMVLCVLRIVGSPSILPFEQWYTLTTEYTELYVVLSSLNHIALALLLLLFMIAAIVRHKALPVDRLVMFLGLCVYACFGFTGLREVTTYDSTEPTNRVYLWITLCIPWIADTLAYFTGRFFGKHKLCPEISPKKTVEGAIGGVASTGIVAVVVYGFSKGWEVLPLVLVFVAVVLLAIVSIFGDLFASVVKRHFGVKDYGKLFPGHGGVMDRFDSTIPVAILMQVLLLVSVFSELL